MDLADTPRKRKRSIVDKSPRRRSSVAVEEVGQSANDLDAMLIRVRCLNITKFMLERSAEVIVVSTEVGLARAILLKDER